MPSGKTHEKVNGQFLYILIFLLVNVGAYMRFGVEGLEISLGFFIGFYVGTFYLGPDLDVKSRPYYRWKWLRFIWIPYQKLFSHRSFWTHGIIIGDVIRIGYICLLLFIPYAISLTIAGGNSSEINQAVLTYVAEHKEIMVSFAAGIMIASFIHIIADHTVSYVKRKRKKNMR